MSTYILDLTTLITLISDICHDPNIKTRFGTLDDWKIQNMSIYEHLIDEIKNPVFERITEKIQDHKLVTTKVVWNKFTTMIEKFGSDAEINRIKDLQIDTIEDDLDDLFSSLESKIWTKESKSIYGTASKHNYKVITGNITVLMEALTYNQDIEYIAHRSRCFVGKKHIPKMNEKID